MACRYKLYSVVVIPMRLEVIKMALRIHIHACTVYVALGVYAVHWCVALCVQAWQGGHVLAALVGGRSQISASVRVFPSGM